MEFNWILYISYEAQMIITDAHLTKEFMDKGGVVLVYVRIEINSTYTYFQLPYNFSFLYDCRMSYYISTVDNTLHFNLFPTNGGLLTNQFQGSNNTFRYVLIPGGIHLRKSSSPPATKDYKATCKYYGIPE